MDLQEFQNPSSKWRGKPFWSWNGELDKDELLRQIDVMQEMGIIAVPIMLIRSG